MSASVSKRAASVGPNHTLRSLQCGLSLLRQFTAERPVRGIAELAQAMNVSRPTAHRYASTCLDLGYLEQSSTRQYRLTRRCAQPGMAMLGSLELMRAARPILRELRQETGRTVSIAVLDGAEVLYLQRLCGFARGQYELERGLGAGERVASCDTAAGRALLAAAGESERVALARIHEEGLTVDEGGSRGDARGIALAIGSERERTSAIEITVPAAAMTAAELVAQLGKPLRASAAALEAALAGELGEERAAGLAQ
jgi:DNA-binding IclR family transcriptional regulator